MVTASSGDLTYAVVTPTHSDADHLRQLASSLALQTRRPQTWLIVDNGQDLATVALCEELVASHSWVRVIRLSGTERPVRGGPVVRAFVTAIAELRPTPPVIVKADADITLEPRYFELLIEEFARDPHLGIASGARYERARDGSWRRDPTPHGYSEASCRAYRSTCLFEIGPLDKRMGWDTADEVSARLLGWRTHGFNTVSFRHHRQVGTRDGSRLTAWSNEGRTAYYLGYRPLYLLLRTIHRMVGDPAAAAMFFAFLMELRHRPARHPNAALRSYVADRQRLSDACYAAVAIMSEKRRARRARMVELLLVSESGGHLRELIEVADAWKGLRHVWVVSTPQSGEELGLSPDAELVAAAWPTHRSVRALLRNAALALKLIQARRPQVVIASGAVGVPFAWIGRLLRVSVLWIECGGGLRPSLSCRLAAPVAHRIFVQWPEMAGMFGKAEYAGSAFL